LIPKKSLIIRTSNIETLIFIVLFCKLIITNNKESKGKVVFR